jgi:hypothetical protein
MTVYNTPQNNTIACCQIASGAADDNYGVGALMRVSTTYRGLLRFDLSSIPSDAICVSANLHMWQGSTGTTRTDYIYAILAANAGWVEGTANSNPQVGSVCWNDHTYNTQDWAESVGCGTAGTDYATVAIGSIVYPGTDDTEATASLDTTTVQGWFGGTNPGLIIRGSDTLTKFWHSDDSATAGYRPYLAVEYTLPDTALTIFPGFGVHVG